MRWDTTGEKSEVIGNLTASTMQGVQGGIVEVTSAINEQLNSLSGFTCSQYYLAKNDDRESYVTALHDRLEMLYVVRGRHEHEFISFGLRRERINMGHTLM